MTWRRRSPRRIPHPDPGIELELQRILDLRASISRRAALIGTYRREIMKLHAKARSDGNKPRIELYFAQARKLDGQITVTEDAIAAAGEQITALSAKLEPADLAWLR